MDAGSAPNMLVRISVESSLNQFSAGSAMSVATGSTENGNAADAVAEKKMAVVHHKFGEESGAPPTHGENSAAGLAGRV
jgi:hypothetical protein